MRAGKLATSIPTASGLRTRHDGRYPVADGNLDPLRKSDAPVPQGSLFGRVLQTAVEMCHQGHRVVAVDHEHAHLLLRRRALQRATVLARY